MSIIAFITARHVIERILAHVGEPTAPPPVLLTRGPPQAEFEFDQGADGWPSGRYLGVIHDLGEHGARGLDSAERPGVGVCHDWLRVRRNEAAQRVEGPIEKSAQICSSRCGVVGY